MISIVKKYSVNIYVYIKLSKDLMKLLNKLFNRTCYFNINKIIEPTSHTTLTLSIDYMAKPFSGSAFA